MFKKQGVYSNDRYLLPIHKMNQKSYGIIWGFFNFKEAIN